MAADGLNMGNMSPEEYAQQQQLNRQQQMATLLMQQGAQNQPQGQMVSGRYVPSSFFQLLNPIANIAASKYVGEKADSDQAKLAAAIRQNKLAKEQQIADKAFGTPDVSTEVAGPYGGNVPMPVAVKEGAKPDYAGALREINSPTNYYGAGADIKPLLYKQMMPEPTTLEREFVRAQNDPLKPYKGSFNEFKNQMSEADKARIGLEGARYNLEKQRFDLENAPFDPTKFGQSAPQAMPQGAPTSVGSPVIKPTVGLAPNAPGYAQGALNLPTTQANPQMPQANAQALPTPPAWVRTQKDYKDWLKSESEPLNEFQGKAVLYGSGMLQANNIINQLATEGTTKGAVVPNFLSGIAALAPLGVGDAAVNAIQAAFRADPSGLVGPDKNQQKLAQAQLGFAIPLLRQTSGANFGAKEVADTIAEYFPLRGESDEVVKQKEASRNRVIQGMKAMSGRGARQIDELGNITPSPSSGWGKAQVVTR